VLGVAAEAAWEQNGDKHNERDHDASDTGAFTVGVDEIVHLNVAGLTNE
jgi:hypothetical protein